MNERGIYQVGTLNLTHIASLNYEETNSGNQQLLLIEQEMHRQTDEHNLMHYWHPMFLTTKASAEDNPTLQQVMASTAQWWEC